MKTFNLFLSLFLFVFTFFSCSKDKSENKDLPKVPTVYSVDLNNDLINDFTINYGIYTWDGLNIFGDGITGDVKPLENSFLLIRKEDSNPFVNENDTVFFEAKTPFQWTANSTKLISISTTENYTWPGKWSVTGKNTSAFYYLGIKISDGNNANTVIGWLKLSISDVTGEIKILDKKLTSKEYIIVGK